MSKTDYQLDEKPLDSSLVGLAQIHCAMICNTIGI